MVRIEAILDITGILSCRIGSGIEENRSQSTDGPLDVLGMLSIRSVSLGFGGPLLLEKISLEVLPAERVCLVGRNGVGKTSLLRIVAGEEVPDSGEVSMSSGCKMAFMPQDVPRLMEGSVFDWVARKLDSEHWADWEIATRVERILAEMQLPDSAEVNSLSAGMKRRVLLAGCLVSEPDLLIMDEPTNHLDIPAIRWIESFLRDQYGGALLFVTHDRAFLQAIATRIVDLDRGQAISWDCDYRTYLERKAAWLDAEASQQAQFDRKLAEEERWIRRGIQARRTRNEGRVRALKKMREEHRSRRSRMGSVRMAIESADRSGAKVISVENLTFSFEAQPIVRDLSLLISRGDKVGLVGPNGAGKTTLLKLLLGELKAQSGTVKLGTNLQIAYFDQLRDRLDPNQTVVDAIADGNEFVEINGKPQHVMSYLRDFLFPPDRARSTVSMLSGGELNRLQLARLFTRPANLLILDEPTNDLDLETLELLEEQIANFQGTVLIVSHDRAFLDEVVTELIVLDGKGGVEAFVGGYSDFLLSNPEPKPPSSAKSTESKGKRPPKTRKFLNRERWELEAIPGEIETLDGELEQLTAELGSPDLYSGQPERVPLIQKRISEIETELQTRYSRWEELEALRAELED